MEDKKESKFFKVIGILIFITVIGLMAYAFLSPIVDGVIYTVEKSHIYSTGEKTTGTIVDYQSIPHTQRGGNVTYTYIPQVQFKTNSGEVITATSSLNESNNIVVPVGSVENIKYEASNPNKFIIANSKVTASSNMFSLNTGLYILSFICIGLLTRGKNKNLGKRRLIYLGIFIIILTGTIIYEYLNIGISVSLIMNTSLLIVIDILGIAFFINSLRTKNKIE